MNHSELINLKISSKLETLSPILAHRNLYRDKKIFVLTNIDLGNLESQSHSVHPSREAMCHLFSSPEVWSYVFNCLVTFSLCHLGTFWLQILLLYIYFLSQSIFMYFTYKELSCSHVLSSFNLLYPSKRFTYILLWMWDWVITRINFCQIVQCLNKSKINYLRSGSQNLSQYRILVVLN